MNRLTSVSQASELIRSGAALGVAGSRACLEALPRGRWIGGTIPYFMDDRGGVVSHDEIFVTTLPEDAEVTTRHYPADQLASIAADGPDAGFSLAIVPAGSSAHQRFAEEAASYPEAFLKPTVGWVAGVHLSVLGTEKPLVFDGATGLAHEDGMVVARVSLPADRMATVDIVNIFEGDDGDVLRFEEVGFAATEVLVGGTRRRLSEYLAERSNLDCKLPLVGDFSGAAINVSIQAIDAASGKVSFYAPVFPNIDYRLARAVPDYEATFRERLRGFDPTGVAFSCNCILNFLYGGFEGKTLGVAPKGPVTFGEIGYQLLNQTLVVVRVQ